MKLPLPKTEVGYWGWAKRFAIDWLVPTASAGFATWSLAQAVLAAFDENDPASERALTTVANVFVKFIGVVANSQLFIIALYFMAISALLLWIWQTHEVTKPAKPLKNWRLLKKRKSIRLRPLAYWTSFLTTKLIGMLISPLILALTVAQKANDTFLTVQSAGLAVYVIVLVAVFHYLMYGDTQQPFTVVISIVDKGQTSRASVLEDRWENTRQALELTAEALGEAAGGLWSRYILIDRNVQRGDLSLGFRASIDEWRPDVRQAFEKAVAAAQSDWEKRGYKFSNSYFSRVDKTKRSRSANRQHAGVRRV